jgi:hypothetical protein
MIAHRVKHDFTTIYIDNTIIYIYIIIDQLHEDIAIVLHFETDGIYK